VVCGRHPRPHDVWPVRVRAHAFGPRRPHRDLLLSPDHAVFFNEALIPIRYLVNGASIAQEETASVTYWHVELPAHDVLLAEGLPAESYLDTGNRDAFANGGAAVALHPDFARGVWERQAVAELVLDGPRLAAARRRLLDRAPALGFRLTGAPGLRVEVDGVRVEPVVSGRRWSVALGAAARRVVLASRSWVPEQTSAEVRDARRLGVAVAGLRLGREALALDDPRLVAGWLPAEPGWRWSDGCGVLDVSGARRLVFDVVLTGTYWDERNAVAGRAVAMA